MCKPFREKLCLIANSKDSDQSAQSHSYQYVDARLKPTSLFHAQENFHNLSDLKAVYWRTYSKVTEISECAEKLKKISFFFSEY